ncbi:MAG: YfhO family protein [Clostridia bacterium]|nr:YfhO family protein [Clostridia bacterium]
MEKSTSAKKQSKFANAIARNKYPIYSFMIAAAIMVFVYIAYKFVPIGNMSILRMDLYHQYGPLFAEFYERLTHFSSMLYSWCSGLGGSFLGNYLNYLSSPLGDLIMLLFGHKNMTEAIAVMVLSKTALSAGTMTYFINKHFKKQDISTTAFGLLYAFCGFFMAYYWNIMWLDGMVLFPLVILGIEKIVDGQPAWLYIGALTAAMYTSYYMAYMICILSVIWFLIYYFSGNTLSSDCRHYDLKLTRREYNSLSAADKSKLSRRNLVNNKFLSGGVKFAGASLLAFGLSCAALIPLYYILKACSATGNSFPTDYSSYFSVFDFLANHLAGVTPTIRSSGDDVLPNIYSGVLPLVLVPLYLFSGKTTLREKIASVSLLAIFYFSFNINYLNFIWHGFHFPNDLPYRFSFAYTFFLLYMAYKAFVNLDTTSSKAIMGVGTAVVAFTILVQKIGSKNVLLDTADTGSARDSVIWATIVFVVIYCVILSLIKNPKYMRSSMCALLLCCVITEIIVVDTGNYEFNQEKGWFTADYDAFSEMKARIDEKEDAEAPNGFYRMELSNLRARMDPSWYYYNGVSVFSSMAYENLSKMMKKIGFYGNNVNSYTYFPQTPVFNSMFSLKYVFDKEDRISSGAYYTYVDANETYKAYENTYNLPIAFCVNPDLAGWSTEAANPFDVQEAMFNLATGTRDVFTKLDGKINSVDNLGSISDEAVASGNFTCTKISRGVYAAATVTLTPETSGEVFIYVHSANSDTCLVGAPNVSKEIKLDTPYIFDCGFVAQGETVTTEIQLPNDKDSADVEFYAVIVNEDNFRAGIDAIKAAGTLEYTAFKDSQFTGMITAASDKILYTSIPYDEGWNVAIDGVAVNKNDYINIGNSLLAVPISAGNHTVTFKYRPQGGTAGIAISVLSLLILLAILFMKKQKVLFFSNRFIDAVTLRNFIPTVRLQPIESGDRQPAPETFDVLTEPSATEMSAPEIDNAPAPDNEES